MPSRWISLEAFIERAYAMCRFPTQIAMLAMVCQIWPVGAILILGLMVYQLARSERGATTHGSAKWATAEDLLNAGCLLGANAIRLGRVRLNKPLPFVAELKLLWLSSLSRSIEVVTLSTLRNAKPKPVAIALPDRIPHCSIFGLSGAGKSTCYAAPQLFHCADSMVVLDSKGELAKMSATHRARKFGHEIVVIDPYGVAEGCGFEPSQVNPLALFADNPERIVDEARRLASALVVKTGEEKDPFWNNMSEILITTTISFLNAEARKEEANLNCLRDILTSQKLTDQMLEHMQQSDACGGLLRRLSGQVLQLQGQTKSSVFTAVNSHIEFLDSLPLAATLSSSTADPKQLIDGKQTIYICLPVDRIKELAGVQRILLSSFINLVFAAGEDRNRRVRFLLDEAATLGQMDSLYNALNFGRSFGLRLMFLFQSVSQVERCFPGSQRDDFFATSANIFCGVNDLNTAKSVSDWIGQGTRVWTSETGGDNWGGSTTHGMTEHSQGKNWGGSRSWSTNEVGRALIQPEEVLQLPKNAAIIQLPNVRPILAEKVPYFEERQRGFLGRVLRLLTTAIAIVMCVAFVIIVIWLLTQHASNPDVREFFERARL